jgi:hypothetical protein
MPSGFLKSRVYAKLLMAPISEHYQTFNRQAVEVEPKAHDSRAYGIGKLMKRHAIGRRMLRARDERCLCKRLID